MIRYRLLLALLTPLIWAWLWLRGKNEPGYRLRWKERLGLVAVEPGAQLWIHGASMGELVAGKPLINYYLDQGQSVLVTAFTPAGSQYVIREFGERVQHCYLPLDWPGAVKRFLRRAQPRRLIILETEIWPNLLAACHQADIDVRYASARLTDSSVRGYQRYFSAKALRDVLLPVRAIGTQTPADLERFIALGVAPDAGQVTGNIKFDLSLPTGFGDQVQQLRAEFGKRPLLLAASTHNGEEAAALRVAEALRERWPNLLLILVPRHPNRFGEVASLLVQSGIPYARRSQQEICSDDMTAYLADTMGEMLAFYAVADVAFVGGSLVPVGGHNVLEPILTQTAVVVGPHLHEQPVAEELAEQGAILLADDEQTLLHHCQDLFANPQLRSQQQQQASGFLEANRGALAKTVALLS